MVKEDDSLNAFRDLEDMPSKKVEEMSQTDAPEEDTCLLYLPVALRLLVG